MSSTEQQNSTIDTIRQIMITDLKLPADADLQAEMPLVGGELDIDSLDVLLLITSLEKQFGFKISSENMDRSVFETLQKLSDFVDAKACEAGEDVTGTVKAVDLDAALAELPHAAPFRFVTALTVLNPGVSGKAIWKVDGAEDFFAGHFPSNPLVPGVLLTEALAQLAGIVGSAQATGGVRLAQVNVTFRNTVARPAEIELHATKTTQIDQLMQFDVRAMHGEVLLADGTVALHSIAGS